MKKLLVVTLGLLLFMSAIPMWAQGPIVDDPPGIYRPVATEETGFYFVDYFSNNINPLAADQVIRAINVGTWGTPLTSLGQGAAPGTGDICENVYVFDNNQEMVACCACRLTPNELSSAAVGAQLTNHALTGTAPVAGVVKLVFSGPQSFNGPTGCRAETAVFNTTSLTFGISAAVFGTHLQAEPPASTSSLFVTETEKLREELSFDEAEFLPKACSFVRYLGSGTPGTCSCTAGGAAH